MDFTLLRHFYGSLYGNLKTFLQTVATFIVGLPLFFAIYYSTFIIGHLNTYFVII